MAYVSHVFWSRRGRNRTDDEGFGDLSDTISPRAHGLIIYQSIANINNFFNSSHPDMNK